MLVMLVYNAMYIILCLGLMRQSLGNVYTYVVYLPNRNGTLDRGLNTQRGCVCWRSGLQEFPLAAFFYSKFTS